ncbi:MAG: hypothetical protein HY731_12240 [Candidatus Tectomicrobia bacterium]|nr:hypothetical protein [Candidatus Tectomicrobia bacterium]
MIIVIGSQRAYGYAYIGDGGGCVIRASGIIEPFLVPQKADKEMMNVLSASLGPLMQGEPVFGTLLRVPGDLLLVGTDGIFDRIEESFPKDVLKGVIHLKGDLQKVADQVLNELAEARDASGYICDDNMTLGLMGDRAQPTLSSGFWTAPSAEQIDEDSVALFRR